MNLPTFKYHPDPIKSGSVVASDKTCPCCKKARGYAYVGPVYAEKDFDDDLCPWCIADGSVAEKFDALFVDTEAFDESVPEEAVDEIIHRTPGYAAWQSEAWPGCCGDATAFITSAGISEMRVIRKELEGEVMGHIVHNMEISGGAATRLMQSLDKDQGPTAYLFQCLKCERWHFHIDQT